MKLPIKKEYFDKIKSGEKIVEYRDAHITFVCEETGEQLIKKVVCCYVKPKHLIIGFEKYYQKGLLHDDNIIFFQLGGKHNG